MAKTLRLVSGPRGIKSLDNGHTFMARKADEADLNGRTKPFSLKPNGSLTESDLLYFCRKHHFLLMAVQGDTRTFVMVRNYPALDRAA